MKYRMKWTPGRSGELGVGYSYAKVRLPESRRSPRRAYEEFYVVCPCSAGWEATRLKPSFLVLAYYPTFEKARQAAEDDYLQVILEGL